ncbi:MAG: D-alanine--D-alanine ligase [Candidatus Thioglobus sp.]|nr:D-alanine--D-alanine ligase [Candidatus Thioglobus sp.]
MIAILMGGNSAERQISLDSGEAVFRSLKNQGIDCFKFDWFEDNLPTLWTQKFDQAFIALHGRGGEDGFIQQQLQQRNIAYTGAGVTASKKCINKAVSKDIWAANNLPICPAVLAEKGEPLAEIKFDLPWAVKPILEGSSIGISKVENASELPAALDLAWKYDSQALVEKWIEGDEYTVSILNGKALPVIKIVVDKGFYDYHAKYHSDKTQYLHPCGLPAAGEKQLQNIALKAFNLTGAKTWGRVDFILDEQQAPYLIEINTVPGLTSHSLVPMAATAAGMSFDELILAILNG